MSISNAVNPSNSLAKYLPISTKIGLQKKKNKKREKFEEIDEEGGIISSGLPEQEEEHIVLAARGYTRQEVNLLNQGYKNIGVSYFILFLEWQKIFLTCRIQ